MPPETDFLSALHAQSLSPKPYTRRGPFGIKRKMKFLLQIKYLMQRFKVVRSATVGPETILESWPTVNCKSGRSATTNNNLPTCVR